MKLTTTTIWIGTLLGATGCVPGLLGGGKDPDAAHVSELCAPGVEHARAIDDVLCDAVYYDRASPDAELAEPLHLAMLLQATYKSGVDDLPLAYQRALAVDPDAVDAALAEAKPDAIVARYFSQLVREYQAWVKREVAKQSDGWRAVFVQPMLDAGARWDAGAARRAPWRRKAQALIERHDAVALGTATDPNLVDEAVELRRAYVAECAEAGETVEACLGDEVVRPLTRAVMHLAQLAGDDPRYGAEDALFLVPNRSRRDYVIRLAANAAAERARAERAAWEEAKADGRSATALKNRWPVEPVEVGDVVLAGADPVRDEDYLGMEEDQGVVRDRIQVAKVTHKGDRAVLTFRKNVQDIATQYNCYETNRIERIDADGTIHYREVCDDDVPTERTDLTEKPANVPWVEAQGIRPMDVVTLILDDEQRGHVYQVQAGDASLPTWISRDTVLDGARLQLGEFRLD